MGGRMRFWCRARSPIGCLGFAPAAPPRRAAQRSAPDVHAASPSGSGSFPSAATASVLQAIRRDPRLRARVAIHVAQQVRQPRDLRTVIGVIPQPVVDELVHLALEFARPRRQEMHVAARVALGCRRCIQRRCWITAPPAAGRPAAAAAMGSPSGWLSHCLCASTPAQVSPYPVDPNVRAAADGSLPTIQQ
jgi:hypothetical protein